MGVAVEWEVMGVAVEWEVMGVAVAGTGITRRLPLRHRGRLGKASPGRCAGAAAIGGARVC